MSWENSLRSWQCVRNRLYVNRDDDLGSMLLIVGREQAVHWMGALNSDWTLIIGQLELPGASQQRRPMSFKAMFSCGFFPERRSMEISRTGWDNGLAYWETGWYLSDWKHAGPMPGISSGASGRQTVRPARSPYNQQTKAAFRHALNSDYTESDVRTQREIPHWVYPGGWGGWLSF